MTSLAKDYPEYAIPPHTEPDVLGLRDYFAAAALTGVLANLEILRQVDDKRGDHKASVITAALAYAYADAMLEERVSQNRKS